MKDLATLPLVSVIMSCHSEPINILAKAVNSILKQTYEDFEFIIVLDNPSNFTLRKYLDDLRSSDSRVIIIYNEKNSGLAYSLNKAASRSGAKYLVRMDADDISDETRLQKQISFMEENSDIDLCGTSMVLIDENDRTIGLRSAIHSKRQLSLEFLYFKTICYHPTWCIRRDVFNSTGGYLEELIVSQDYEFLHWLIVSEYNISNISQPLLKYRITAESVIFKKAFLQRVIKTYVRKHYANRQQNRYEVKSIDVHSRAAKFYELSVAIPNLSNIKGIKIFLIFFSSFLSRYRFQELLDIIIMKLKYVKK